MGGAVPLVKLELRGLEWTKEGGERDDELEVLKLELALKKLKLKLELKSPKLGFEFLFEFIFAFETWIRGYSDALDEVLERTRRRDRKSEGNDHTSTPNEQRALASLKVLPGLGKLKTTNQC
jgi:hypothetical protein